MGRKFRITLAVICLLFLVGFASLFFFVRDVDPVYQGKRLSVWSREIVPWQGPNTPEAVALRKQGSNAAPLVAMMVNARDSTLKSNIVGWLSKQPIKKLRTQYQPASATQMGGLKAAIVLGPDARAAAPAISQLLRDFPGTVKDRTVVECGIHVLATLGPDGVPGLVQALTNSDSQIRMKAAELLGRDGAAATPVVISFLESCARGSDAGLVNVAQQSLAIIKQRLAFQLPNSATQWTQSTGTPPAHPSAWDTRDGTLVLGNSPLVPGFQPGDMLGTRLGGQGAEVGTTIFADGMPDGTVHWVEWQTPAPVTIRSFGLIGFHQPADQYFERSFRDFRLLTWSDEQNQFVEAWSEPVAVPYGDGYFSCLRYLFRNLEKPVTAKRFKAEFVQNSIVSYNGSRVVALYGFTNQLDLSTVSAALKNLDINTQTEGLQYLSAQAARNK